MEVATDSEGAGAAAFGVVGTAVAVTCGADAGIAGEIDGAVAVVAVVVCVGAATADGRTATV